MKNKKTFNFKKGFIQLQYIALAIILVSAAIIPLASKLSQTRVTTQQRATELTCASGRGYCTAAGQNCTTADTQQGWCGDQNQTTETASKCCVPPPATPTPNPSLTCASGRGYCTAAGQNCTTADTQQGWCGDQNQTTETASKCCVPPPATPTPNPSLTCASGRGYCTAAGQNCTTADTQQGWCGDQNQTTETASKCCVPVVTATPTTNPAATATPTTNPAATATPTPTTAPGGVSPTTSPNCQTTPVFSGTQYGVNNCVSCSNACNFGLSRCLKRNDCYGGNYECFQCAANILDTYGCERIVGHPAYCAGATVTTPGAPNPPTSGAATATPGVPPSCNTCPAGNLSKTRGNANCDTLINADDLTFWYNQWFANGTPATTNSADFNCDGTVDLSDLAMWLSNSF